MQADPSGAPLMAGTWWVAVVSLSDSFGTTVEGMVRGHGGDIASWSPAEWGARPRGAVACMLLAGGAEQAAIELLPSLAPSEAPTYVVGAAENHRFAAACVAAGATDYFALPGDADLLARTIGRLAEQVEATAGAAAFASDERQSQGFDSIIGRSAALRAVIEQAKRVAQHRDVTILLGGETGTGKEVLARALHYDGPRAQHPFVEINCAALPANLLESELFGHEKGAFTGATSRHIGLFEAAEGGTLFLDEVGAMPIDLQPKLLRALEERTIRRVGGREQHPIDIRLIAATHKDLDAAVRQGEFREDLMYRLNVVRLTLPPLRERGGDTELLAEVFVQRLAAGYGMDVPRMTPEFRAQLNACRWPGNVRELRNAIERALVLSPAGTLAVAELPVPSVQPASNGPLPFPATMAEITRAAALAALHHSGGNKSEASRLLGISRPRLQRLLDGSDRD